jgi:hypothetical protein
MSNYLGCLERARPVRADRTVVIVLSRPAPPKAFCMPLDSDQVDSAQGARFEQVRQHFELCALDIDLHHHSRPLSRPTRRERARVHVAVEEVSEVELAN